MEPTTTKADDNELQKAINNITSATGAGTELDAVSAVADKVAANSAEPAEEAVEEPAAPVESGIAQQPKAAYGDPDLGVVKTKALTDLRPLVDKVDMSPEARFKIYREIIAATHDKAAIEPAYEAAIQIAVEKDKAEALLFIVETIDSLGIGAANQ
ncbi:hypothetical protein FWF89_01550 [Candidatus Saccharibacteria bacterium]|nr:hypothetical protein [Candidatus Saccharibacteria bacterium]